MLKLALVFLIIGLIAGALGFTGVGGAFVGLAKIIFFVAVAIFVLFLLLIFAGINFFT